MMSRISVAVTFLRDMFNNLDTNSSVKEVIPEDIYNTFLFESIAVAQLLYYECESNGTYGICVRLKKLY